MQLRVTDASPRRTSRMTNAMWRQAARSLVCPEGPRLDGQRALVTGGTEGVGLGTSRGLLRRGARVIMASRSAAKGERAQTQLREELGDDASVSFLSLDLADLECVRDACRRLAAELGDERLDVVVCNAGVWPQRHNFSAQGHELAFATNVLGHFLLLRLLLESVLAPDARVVIVTGDIYILSSDCTPDYSYRTPFGGMIAYCRSKLGNLWIAGELQRRHPGLRVRVAHPGVVATGLGGTRRGIADRLSRRLMLDVDQGAQTVLYGATQTGLPAGAYLHNVHGLMRLADGDPGADVARAAQLWERCETLCQDPGTEPAA